MSTTQMKSHVEIIKDFFHRLWTKQDMSVIDEVFTSETVLHTSLGERRGIFALREVVEKYFDAFTDFEVTVTGYISSGDKVVVQWEVPHACYQGGLFPSGEKGKTVSYKGVTIFRMKDGYVQEYWAHFDRLSVLEQLTS